MEEWALKHIGKLLSAFMATVLFAGGLLGYIYDQDSKNAAKERKSLYDSLNKEISSRKSSDKDLEDMIKSVVQTKLNTETFIEFKALITYMKDDMDDMSKDIKRIRQNTDD